MNYNYLSMVFVKHSNPKLILDSIIRGQLWSIAKVLKSFTYLFLLNLYIDFLGLMDRINTVF